MATTTAAGPIAAGKAELHAALPEDIARRDLRELRGSRVVLDLRAASGVVDHDGDESKSAQCPASLSLVIKYE